MKRPVADWSVWRGAEKGPCSRVESERCSVCSGVEAGRHPGARSEKAGSGLECGEGPRKGRAAGLRVGDVLRHAGEKLGNALKKIAPRESTLQWG